MSIIGFNIAALGKPVQIPLWHGNNNIGACESDLSGSNPIGDGWLPLPLPLLDSLPRALYSTRARTYLLFILYALHAGMSWQPEYISLYA